MVTRIQPAVSDPDAARSVVALLSQLPDSEPVPPAIDSTQLLDGLAQLAAVSLNDLPEVVLVHELIGPLPALELIRETALRFPAVGVILIARDTSPALYSAAMDAGARGVVGLPLAYDEVAARVGPAAAWATGVRRHLTGGGDAAPGPGGHVVAVTGAKGGVGTTLTAVQLALAAAASGRGTALVDMDLQSGDVASYLDVQFRRSAADLAGIKDISPRVLQDAVFTHESGLGLLLAPGEGERGEEIDDRGARQIIGAMKARYEIVVVDCGTQLNAGNAAAIELADRALLLTTPDVVSVRAAKRMVRMWDRLQIRKAEETLTIVNRASRHTEIQPPLIARIVGTPVARSTVPANFKELQTAVDAGRMQDLDARGPVRQALWGLAGELGLVTENTENGARGGFGGMAGKQRNKRKPAKGGGAVGPGGGAVPPVPGDRRALPGGPGAPPGGPGGPGPDGSGGTGAHRALPPGSRGRYGSDRGALSFGRRKRGGATGEGDDEGLGSGPENRGDEGDRGALSVEFAGMAPIVLVVLAILWQCVLIGYTFSLAGNAADEAARAATSAAADGDPQGACQSAATEHLPAQWKANSTVSCQLTGNLWRADVDLRTPILFPGAGNLPFTVSGRAGAAEEGRP
ncbi:AAA family ATPase [Streptomyces sp. NPDC054796]